MRSIFVKGRKTITDAMQMKEMKGTLRSGDTVAIGLMLFALFLGAGNLIFPPVLGQQAGENVWIATIGFLVTGVGLPLLAVTAVAFVGGDLKALSSRVHPIFAFIFPLVSYLAIGPFFAIPRTGAVSFEMGMKPFLAEGLVSEWYILFLYTAVFFGATWYLSLNPSKLIDWFGRFLTPLLVLIVAVIVSKAIIDPIGEPAAPLDVYKDNAFFGGFIQGYLTMDAISALVFGIVVVQVIRSKGITESNQIAKTTITSGIIAVFGLTLIYLSLAYLGSTSTSLGVSDNGGLILTKVVNELYGTSGKILLGLVITLACLTTSVGLTSACAGFFTKLFPKLSHRMIVTMVCVFSLVVSNLGLTQLIAVTLPVLMIIYPVAIVLIVLSYFHKWIGQRNTIYIGAILGALVISLFNGLESANIKFDTVTNVLEMLPLYKEGIGWLLPSCIGGMIGYFLYRPNESNTLQKKGA
ncbi:branched-chain amino acid transport system II carrier protein [Bacillus cytotoxicus NVH 391-98]|uniref:Branched-chain amino acid transport system carrier protein n=3 Tax=Bacillus TaxID=1386 RepID=A7GP06_BACCN|nr:branched-chain amino acid transport system II carrier protein [Bacillus cytotoxicus NVH 391-98]SCN35099.1 Branched-chain amino acid transport system II carrier protein [Bacillus cytotoxicus]